MSLNDFECALSKDSPAHLLREPVLIAPCQHCACKACYKRLCAELKTIKCCKCDLDVEKKEINDEVCAGVVATMRENLNELLQGIDVKIREAMGQITNRIQDHGDRIGIHINYIKEEVEVKIESMKIELDKLHDGFKNELGKLESDLFKDHELLKKEADKNIEMGETQLLRLNTDLNRKELQTINCLYENENELKNLRRFVEKINNEKYELNFKIADVELSKQQVGCLSYYNAKTIDKYEIETRLLDWSYKITSLSTSPNDLCILPNNLLAVVNSDNDNITIFNEKLEFIRKIDQSDLKCEAFKPMRITTNQVDKIYVTEFTKSEAIMMDTSYNLIRRVALAGFADKSTFWNGVAFHKGKVYVADTEDQQIHILTEDLEFESSKQLEYPPWIIKISKDNVACVSRFDRGGIYFYDVDTFSLKAYYDNHGYGRISEINSYFLEYCHVTSSIYIYEKDGTVFKKVDISRLNEHIGFMGDGAFVFYNGSLILSTIIGQKLLSF